MNSKYLISGLIFTASVIIGVVLVYPAYQNFKVSAQLVADKQSELDSETALVTEVNKIHTQYKKAESDLLKVSDLLPSFNHKSIADLFVEVENIASESGVLISSISFNENQAKSGNNYKTVNINLSVLSSYDAFKKFSLAIEKNQHLMDMMTASIAQGGATSDEKEQNNQENGQTATATTTESAFDRPEDQSFTYMVSINAYYQ